MSTIQDKEISFKKFEVLSLTDNELEKVQQENLKHAFEYLDCIILNVTKASKDLYFYLSKEFPVKLAGNLNEACSLAPKLEFAIIKTLERIINKGDLVHVDQKASLRLPEYDGTHIKGIGKIDLISDGFVMGRLTHNKQPFGCWLRDVKPLDDGEVTEFLGEEMTAQKSKIITAYCYKHGNTQYIDPNEITFIEQNDSNWGNYKNDHNYRELTISFKNGVCLEVLVKSEIADQISEKFVSSRVEQ